MRSTRRRCGAVRTADRTSSSRVLIRLQATGIPFGGILIAGDCSSGQVVASARAQTKQCPKCKGKGYVEKLYHRCTSFVGVLDDRSSLEKWKLRIVLTGLGVDAGLLASLERTDPDDKEMLDAIAAEAFEIGEGHAKAQKGTDLHTLTEYVDKGWTLPEALRDPETGQERPVTLQDRADLAAWQRVSEGLSMAFSLGSEVFRRQDEYEIGGTYDRLSCSGCSRFAPACSHTFST